jgi:hypothetical protein
VEGFAPEVAWSPTAAAKQLEERPGHPPHIRSHYLLDVRQVGPVLAGSTPASTTSGPTWVRWEKVTRPFSADN